MVLFIASSTTQARMFGHIARQLGDGTKKSLLTLEHYFGLPILAPLHSFDKIQNLPCDIPIQEPVWSMPPETLTQLGRQCWTHGSSFLKEHNPQVVVIGNDRSFQDRILLDIAHRIGSRSVLVQDGSLTSKSFQSSTPGLLASFRQGIRARMGQIFPDKYGYLQHVCGPTPRYGDSVRHRIAASDSNAVVLLKQNGIADSKIFLTGQPRFDDLAIVEAAGLYPETIRQKAEGRKIVIFATQPMSKFGEQSVEVELAYTNAVIRCLAGKSDHLFCILRPHPAEEAGKYAALIPGGADNLQVNEEGSTPHLIAASDGLITAYSTTALEAIILGKPVLLVNPFGVEQGLPYAHEGAAVEITSLDELDSAIHSVFLKDETRQKLAENRGPFLDKYVGPVDGKAARRVADVILRLAES